MTAGKIQHIKYYITNFDTTSQQTPQASSSSGPRTEKPVKVSEGENDNVHEWSAMGNSLDEEIQCRTTLKPETTLDHHVNVSTKNTSTPVIKKPPQPYIHAQIALVEKSKSMNCSLS